MSRIGQLEQRVAEQAKPCPFCGIAPKVVSDPAGVHIWCGHVPCFSSGTAYGADEAAALRTWNTRHGEIRARAEMKERCAQIAADEADRQEAEYIAARDKAGDGWTVEVRREWAETYARRIATARHIAAAIRSQDDGPTPRVEPETSRP